jgi:AraC-like DNA-binding protein
MDALSEALKSVRMTGAIFFNAEFTAPWGFFSPATEKFAPNLAPGTEQIVIYHFITEGSALVRVEGLTDMPLAAGDVVVFPHGHPHTMWHGQPNPPLDVRHDFLRFISGDLPVTRFGGGGPVTRFVCGYFGCERQAARLFLSGLPPVLKVSIRGSEAGSWLENSITHCVLEAATRRPGRMALLSKLSEALFIETLRHYTMNSPPEHVGWLAGARDPMVGDALALLHRKPAHPWKLAALATEVGASRTVLAERFASFLGEPPMTYLGRLRLLIGARLLQMTRRAVIQIALEVGYESEAAFNRAFKREFGLPPAQYRRRYWLMADRLSVDHALG